MEVQSTLPIPSHHQSSASENRSSDTDEKHLLKKPSSDFPTKHLTFVNPDLINAQGSSSQQTPRYNIIEPNSPATQPREIPLFHQLPLSRAGSTKKREHRRSLGGLSASSSFLGSTISASPSSCYPSPLLNAMTDMTPLPSPVLQANETAWRLHSRPPSRDFSISSTKEPGTAASALPRRKPYSGLSHIETATRPDDERSEQSKARSVSQYVPDHLKHQPSRNASARLPEALQVSTVSPPLSNISLQRERHFALERGIKPVIQKPPTPPPSSRGAESDEEGISRQSSLSDPTVKAETYTAVVHRTNKEVHWRNLLFLGEGSFSKVYLAAEIDDRVGHIDISSPVMSSPVSTKSTSSLRDPGLVAVKVVQHGPVGGASSERIEVSVKRELGILKKIRHPSLIHIIASSIESERTLLVMQYCAGGDLFNFASRQGTKSMGAAGRAASIRLTQRIFGELVGAVDYLHQHNIIHRDIKLENVLLNVPQSALQALITSDTSGSLDHYTEPIITLTDMGLSKEIDPSQPMQTTRCGSEDYAAPELLMGLQYDGRSTDCWALGVMLYALLEGRLPFDPPADKRSALMSEGDRRRKMLHRIAHIEFSWMQYHEDGDSDGDDDNEDASRADCAWGLDADQTVRVRAGKEIVTNLLKRGRSRWAIKDLDENAWVQSGMPISGLQFPASAWDADE